MRTGGVMGAFPPCPAAPLMMLGELKEITIDPLIVEIELRRITRPLPLPQLNVAAHPLNALT